MAYRFDEYRAAVRRDYELRKTNNSLRFNLSHPTAANLRDEALYVCSNRFKKVDGYILAEFFDCQPDQAAYVAAISRSDPDAFKPVSNFLKRKTQNPEEKQVELLAWLMDFKDRPYATYILVHPDPGLEADGPGLFDVPGGDPVSQEEEIKIDRIKRRHDLHAPKKKRYTALFVCGALILLTVPLLFFLGGPHPSSAGLVFVCNSYGAKRYHLRSDCIGLRNCKHELIRISVDSAKHTGRSLCHLEGGR